MQHNEALPNTNTNKEILRTMFREVFESSTYDEAIVRRYFSSEYIQSVDGKTLDLEHFLQHVKVLKQAVKAMTFHFNTLAADGNIVFSNHLVKSETVEGRMSEIHVIAEFRFHDGKVVSCDELTRMLTGDERERDIGSRH